MLAYNVRMTNCPRELPNSTNSHLTTIEQRKGDTAKVVKIETKEDHVKT